jgi:hypothetical protein
MSTFRQFRNFWLPWASTIILACPSVAGAQTNYKVTDQGPLGAAHMSPTSTVRCVGKYPIRTDVNFAPSREQNASIGLFFRTTRHHVGSVSDRSGSVEPSE